MGDKNLNKVKKLGEFFELDPVEIVESELDSIDSPPFSLPLISSEQQAAVNLIKTHNLQIDAVAGSGKTTTTLYIAKSNPDAQILLLTYNKRLKFETRKKAHHLKIPNLFVHTFHSFFYNYFDGHCHDDSTMGRIIQERLQPKRAINFSIVIVDEAQDMTPRYFEAVSMLLSLNNAPSFRMCFLGDVQQCIYTYNRSDSRFLTFAHEFFTHFPQNKLPWTKSTLKISYRCPSGVTNFVNHCMIKSSKLEAWREGSLPKYIICDCFEEETEGKRSQILPYLFSVLESGASFADIFILAPSVRSSKTISRRLANSITQYNSTVSKEKKIPVYVPVDDEEHVDEDILKGKLCFLTFHQAKGLERKIVFVLNFDQAYFEYYNKTADPDLCPNELYVAVTRASEQLFLFHHYKNNYLPFLAHEQIPLYCDVQGSFLQYRERASESKTAHRYSVMDLIRHLPYDVIEEACAFFSVYVISEEEEKIPLPGKVAEGDLFELVNDINGTAIPAWLELAIKQKITILEHLLNDDLITLLLRPTEISPKQKKFLKRMAKKKSWSIPEVLHIANIYNSVLSGYDYKMEQITAYDWLPKTSIDLALERLKHRLSDKCNFEELVETELFIPELNGTFTVVGSIDCIDNRDIYEFKCVERLTETHLLQLAIYMYLYKAVKSSSNDRHFLLWNILTDEKREIQASFENLEALVRFLIRKKNSQGETFSDRHFIEENMHILQKYLKSNRKKEHNSIQSENKTPTKGKNASQIQKTEIIGAKARTDIIYEGNKTYSDFLLLKMKEARFLPPNPEITSLNKILVDQIEKCPNAMISASIKDSLNRATKIGRKFHITESDAREWKLFFCEIYGELKAKEDSNTGVPIQHLKKLIDLCEKVIKISS